MAYIRGEDRHQASLLPAALEDYVAADGLIRVVDGFVASLDFGALGFRRSVPAEVGAPGYDPRDLLRLYLYGYLNEIRSSRRLERECGRNVELMWLMGRLAPDFKTIADFRKDNGPALVAACRAFVLFCRKQGLIGGHTVAVDGTKFRAAASARKVKGRREIAEEKARIEARIAGYLAALDEADSTEEGTAGAGAVAEALEALRDRRAVLDVMADELDATSRTTLVETEPDARPMGKGKGQKPPSYNVQTAVDTENKLIIHHAVTTEATDSRLLHSMALGAKQVLEAESLKVVADAGYSSGAQAAACEGDGIEACVPAKRSPNTRGNFYDRSAFTYDAESDTYTCPAERKLLRKSIDKKKQLIRYQAQDCSGCSHKPHCTGTDRRTVKRSLFEDELRRMNARVGTDPGLMRLRQATVEHPFGTIKRMTSGRFLMRGLEKTTAETALAVLAYNLLRVANILGVPALRARLA
jgi:transposase/IS5 family transposase